MFERDGPAYNHIRLDGLEHAAVWTASIQFLADYLSPDSKMRYYDFSKPDTTIISTDPRIYHSQRPPGIGPGYTLSTMTTLKKKTGDTISVEIRKTYLSQ